MLTILSVWIKAGSQYSTADSISSVRITNIISLVFALTLFIQLPLMLFYWQQGGQLQSLINSLAILLCPLVVQSNRNNMELLAKFILVSIFICYLMATAWHLGPRANVHYFYILGIFSCPFIFQTNHHVINKLLIGLFGLLTLIFGFMTGSSVYQDNAYIELVRSSNLINLTCASLLCAFYIQRNTMLDREKLKYERERSDKLLLNILPTSIAKRLKESNKPVADYFDEATILFADIANFSAISKHHSALKLVTLLNELYSEFDLLLLQYHLEKIKTVGDEVMAVCGVPERDICHARQVCRCALKLQQCFAQFCISHHLDNGLRIGINTGPVVAGVIGKSKFSYDLWGESVNMASRMESYGQSHKIQITEKTYRLIHHEFICHPRGKILVKGMGQVNCYWLLAEKSNSKNTKLEPSLTIE